MSVEDYILHNTAAIEFLLTPRDILNPLKADGAIKPEDAEQIDSQQGDISATKLLLKKLQENNKRGWGRSFMNALASNEENKFLLMVIETRCDISLHKCIWRLFNLFRDKLQKHIVDVEEFSIILRSSGVFRDSECEQISAKLTQSGPIAATRTALNYIHKQSPDWFNELLVTLWKTNRRELLYEILGVELEDEVVKQKWDIIGDYLGDDDNDNELKLRALLKTCVEELKEKLAAQPTYGSLDAATEEFQVMVVGDGEDMDVMDAGCKTNEVTAVTQNHLGHKRIRLTEGYEEDMNIMDARYKRNEVTQNELGHKRIRLTEDLQDGDILEDCNITDFPRTAQNILRGNPLNICDGEVDNNPPPSTTDDQGNESDEDNAYEDETKLEFVEPRQLQLRNYQLELADPAVQGKNTLIIAPTGSGKTHVAMYITKIHMDSRIKQNLPAKAIFLVPTVALVKQQTLQFKRYLPEFMCNGISGSGGAMDSDLKPQFETVCQTSDIIVATPQLLVDALNRKNEVSLKLFSIIFLDECHKANKGHPYSVLGMQYIKEFCRGGIVSSDIQKPQIVGMTASVGVGNSSKSSPMSIEEHIVKLCGKMAIEVIQTVVKNKDELDQHRTLPIEEIYEIPRSKEDAFQIVLTGLMHDIERLLRSLAVNEDSTNLAEDKKLEKLLSYPKIWDYTSYTLWVHSLSHTINDIVNVKYRRMVYACIEELKLFNDALFLNVYCISQDALEFIQDKKKARECTTKYKARTDVSLDKMFKDKLPDLLQAAHHGNMNESNLKLRKLKEVILQYEQNCIAKGEYLRAIIFCKTRELTAALASWINNDSQLKHLNAHYCTSSSACAEEKGLTLTQQNEVLASFRQGVHKIIVATTVVEEGLDVADCNLVIRYNYVTNVTARVQSKGRARKSNAHYVLIGECSSVRREELNSRLELAMNEAVTKIISKPSDWFQDQVKRSIDLLIHGSPERPDAMVARVSRPSHQLKCLQCMCHVCSVGELRLIQGKHHVVIAPKFEKKCQIKSDKPMSYDGLSWVGKVCCGVCNKKWGKKFINAAYPGQSFIALRIESFNVIDEYNHRTAYKKWVHANYDIQPLTGEDIVNMNECIPEVQ